MGERAPAFQFYPRQFAGDDQVMGMDLDTVGAHILLMCYASASPERYRITANERAIRTLLRNPDEENWLRIETQLLSGAWKVSDDGQWWAQDGLRRTLLKQKKFNNKQRANANARWTKDQDVPDRCQTDARPNTNAVPDGMPKACSSSSSSSSSLNHKPNGADGNFNSTDVAQILCRENGWSGGKIVEALRVSVEFKSQEMPECSLEQVGEWLIKAFFDHETAHGKFAGGPITYFQQAKYPHSKRKPAGATFPVNDPAAYALVAMEGD